MLRESLRLASEEGRVVIFLEPIALYPTRDLLVEGDEGWAQSYCPEKSIAWGEIGIHGTGDDLALVSYGNGHFLCEQARQILAKEHRIACTSFDLRWLVPWPEEALMQALKRFRRVLVVDECRRSGSLSEAILARILETLSPAPHVARITGTDAPIPLGDASALMMPSVRDIVAASQKLHSIESKRELAHV